MIRLSPLAAAVVFALASAPALSQEPAPAPASTPRTLDTLIVTGTRVSTRTVAQSQSPIDVITPEALQATGTTELATALSRAVPSLNFPRPAISDGTNAVRPAQLRGLDPGQVLVLVNGKRYHGTALVNLNGTQGRGSSPADLNTIPIAAVQRVEVLRDGASAQYGSDAIAGVINVVLKGSAEGGSVGLTGGQYSAGDGEQAQLDGNAGFALGETGALHLAAQVGQQDYTDRARPWVFGPGTTTNTSNVPNNSDNHTPLGQVVQRWGDPEVDYNAISANADFSPAEAVNFYGYGIASRRDVLSNGFYRNANNNRNVLAIYPDGFLPLIRNIAEDGALVLGVKGETTGGWNVDLSYNYGVSQLSFGVEDSLNRSFGAASPTQFHSGALEYSQNLLNLDVNKLLEAGETTMTLAFGAEWKGEKFNQSPGDFHSWANGGELLNGGPTASGAQVFPGFKPSDAGHFNRESYGVYASLEAEFNEQFSAGIAVRSEDYSDFGSETTGKLSGRFAPNEQFAIRATVSTGFHAPTLQQQFFQSTATNFIGGQPFDIRTFRVNDPAAIALGAEPLKAETSNNYSLGLVLTPIDKLYITIDAYLIDIDDRILLSENLTSTAVRNYLNANVEPSLGGGRYFTNAVDTRTKGVDVIGTYSFDLAGGVLDMTAAYNYNKTTIERIADNPPSLMAIDPTAVRFGRVEIGRLTDGSPRDKFQLGGNYRLGNWGFNANATRYGEFTVLFGATPTPANIARDQTFDAQWTLDLSGSYELDNWQFTLGADNVLNEYPDEVIYANSTNGQIPYSASSPAGFNGAYVYGKVGYKW